MAPFFVPDMGAICSPGSRDKRLKAGGPDG